MRIFFWLLFKFSSLFLSSSLFCQGQSKWKSPRGQGVEHLFAHMSVILSFITPPLCYAHAVAVGERERENVSVGFGECVCVLCGLRSGGGGYGPYNCVWASVFFFLCSPSISLSFSLSLECHAPSPLIHAKDLVVIIRLSVCPHQHTAGPTVRVCFERLWFFLFLFFLFSFLFFTRPLNESPCCNPTWISQ